MDNRACFARLRYSYVMRFPDNRSPSFAPVSARKKAIAPPKSILVRLNRIKLYGVKRLRLNIKATDKNAPAAGSLIRRPGDTTPIIKPPIKKLTRLSKPCIMNRRVSDINRPITTSPTRPPRSNSTPMKIAILTSIHLNEKGRYFLVCLLKSDTGILFIFKGYRSQNRCFPALAHHFQDQNDPYKGWLGLEIPVS